LKAPKAREDEWEDIVMALAENGRLRQIAADCGSKGQAVTVT